MPSLDIEINRLVGPPETANEWFRPRELESEIGRAIVPHQE